MNSETNEQKPRLLAVLREAVGIVQMILFKEIRAGLAKRRAELDPVYLSMLAGAITNEVFGTRNPEDKFARFRTDNWADIEQELFCIKTEMPKLCENITDALRIQTLCDHQEGIDTSPTLARANDFGILMEDREVPLPSSFMTLVRELGERHGLVVPPAQITPAEDTTMVH